MTALIKKTFSPIATVVWLLFTLAVRGHAISCDPLPAINPAVGFFDNFNNACYVIPFSSGNGNSHAGDLNAIYNQMYYHVMPGYELVVIGTFPNARFFSVTAYDAHEAMNGEKVDQSILPLYEAYKNPYLPGATWAPGQFYALRVGLGNPAVTNPAPGCDPSKTTYDQNFIDASQIHSGITWNGDPAVPPGFPVHKTGPSTGGYLMAREYVSTGTAVVPNIIVRRLSDGCAVPASQVAALNIITTDESVGSTWYDQPQIAAHKDYAKNIQPVLCYPKDPLNKVVWFGQQDYVPGDNTDAAYMSTLFSTGTMQSLITGVQFMQLRFAAPTTPTTPCLTGGCTLTGNEQLRYFSVSLQAGANTIASFKDSDFVHDPDGNVDLILGLGAAPPKWVTAANYYTFISLVKLNNPLHLSNITIRQILPNAGFSCSTFNVPHLTTEYNPVGGYMGPYVPTIDYPTSAQIPTVATPIVRPDSCTTIPKGPPVDCSGS